MFNKLKKAVKYVIKKVKQGVEIMAKTINDAKCAVAKTAEVGANVVSDIYKARCEVTIKKLDMIKSASSTIHDDIKSIGSKTCNCIKNNKLSMAVLLLGVAGSLVCSEFCK